MSASSTQKSSSGEVSGSQRNTGYIDDSIYIYEIPQSQYSFVCACLNTNVPWEEIAREMQFNEMHILVSLVIFDFHICNMYTSITTRWSNFIELPQK